jgi:amino acid adenylation domain-containing protein
MADEMTRAATPLQAGMYFHAAAQPESGVDVEHVILHYDGALDVEAFRRAWNTSVAELPILRSAMRVVDGIPRLVTASEVEMAIDEVDLTDSSEEDAALERIVAADRTLGFDLEHPPLMRFTHCRLPGGRSWTLWSFHHLLLDGRSFPLVLERVLARYRGETPPPLPEADFDAYADALLSLDHTEAVNAWTTKLQPIEGPSSIPASPDTNASAAALLVHERRLSPVLSDGVRSLAQNAGASVNNVVQAAWALLLHHHSQQPFAVFGSTRAGRHTLPDSDDTIGLLILTVPFVVPINAESTTADLLSAVRAEQHALRNLEAVPLEMIQRASGFGATPIFDTLVMYDDATLDRRMRTRIDTDAWRFHYEGQTNYPLTLLVYGEQELLVRLEYDTARYAEDDAARLLGRFTTLLESMVVHPDRPAVELAYLTPEDHERLRVWNDTANDWDQTSTLIDLLEDQVRATPERLAIRQGERAYTYAAFHDLRTSLAQHLRSTGVGPGILVGVAAERSIEMELVIHAVVLAGGGFVPLDPSLPDERLAFMADDAGVQLVLGQQHLLDRTGFAGLDVLAVDAENPSWPTDTVGVPEPRPTARDLAYALFTSGSTGTPKCAANEHRGIVNRLRWMQEAFPLDESDVVLQKTPYSFDVSVWEHFWPLCYGAQLVIADPGTHQDPRALVRAITAAGVTTIHFVPSMLQLFVEEPSSARCTSLRRIIASGEALPRQLQDRVFETLDTELHNLYGPTEAAIDVTWWACEPESPLPQIPIGRAISNTQIHILDAQCNPVPCGVAGELHIGGRQVGRGYLNRDELTTERFLPDPFQYDEQIYKTGDLARFMPDGNIEYLGRLDHQVKIRGLRIELGEIEAVILDHPTVRETVVMAREDQPGHQQLVAYTVGEVFDVAGIKEHCARVLPTWMIPDQWIRLDVFPLNSSGKVERKNLPAPVYERAEVDAPESSAEELVSRLWADVLEHAGFGRRDVFFDIGGSSLSLIRLCSMLSDELGREVAVADLLRHTTVEAQARHIVDRADGDDAAVNRASRLATEQRAARGRRRVVRR